MKINYKYTTIALILALIVTYSWHWNAIFSRQNDGMKMDKSMNMGSMHKMADGSMMGNDGMTMGNTQMSMDSMMMDMLAGMKGRSGTELEKVFLQEMVAHHQGAVDMANELLKDKTIRPELAKFARDIVSAQTGEISMQKKWLKDWFSIVK